jgi:hypothetical protein
MMYWFVLESVFIECVVGKKKRRARCDVGPRTHGPLEKASTTRQTPTATPRDHIVASTHNMAKSYKQMKEAWVSGHTGSSVADVNSVSLAMPVQYTHPQFEQ